jgi:hypothetical protein
MQTRWNAQQSKRFFFEKKKQKTFTHWSPDKATVKAV